MASGAHAGAPRSLLLEEFPDAEDAIGWLQASTAEHPRTLGELSSHGESLVLVNEFVKVGASNVFVVNIDKDDDGSLNSGHLLVEVPLESREKCCLGCG